jgi:hypothetical protein
MKIYLLKTENNSLNNKNALTGTIISSSVIEIERVWSL